MPLQSMTGFADLTGSREGLSWTWSAKSVNNRGLDLRMRLPEGFEALEAVIRAAAGKRISRGAVSVALRLNRASETGAQVLNTEALDTVLALAGEVEARARDAGLPVAPVKAVDLLGFRGVLESEAERVSEREGVMEALGADVQTLIADLHRSRLMEGEGLLAIVSSKVDGIEALAKKARETAEVRDARAGELLRSRVAAVLDSAEIDEDRLAQELALIAVKADVSEELDRLDLHVAAARELLAAKGPVGRKLDFLTQEFNREANTLCSKAGTKELTAIGLELKVVVDQLREQVQNVE